MAKYKNIVYIVKEFEVLHFNRLPFGHILGGLQHILGALLKQNGVVSFPCLIDVVVVVHVAQSAVAGVTMAAHHLPAFSDHV